MSRRTFLLAGLVPAALAAATLAGRPVGLGVALIAFALVGVAARATRTHDAWRAFCWAAAAALALIPALRSAGWVAALSLLAAAVLASLGAAGARSWRGVTVSAVGWLRNLVPGLVVLVAASLRAAGERRVGRLGPAARGAALAALLLAIFVPLFVTADAAFAEIVDDAFAWDLSVDRTADRVAIFVLVAGLAGALALTAATPATAASGPRTPLLGRTEWRIALTVLDALFAAFVVLQLAALFGGDEHVLRTAGLTYAEYAREGFAQLMAVAALTLAVIALARRDDRVLRVLLGLLCALTLVVLASALKRLGLYEEAFGFTRLRLLAHGGIFWLAGLFVLVLAAGAARSATWLPRATVALSALIGLAFGLSNPDARIAEHNIARYERTGEIDLLHLAHLSPDAAPALARLPDPQAQRALGPTRAELRAPDGLVGTNLGRARARAALKR